ncbi:MAG: hypothetical protein ABI862_03780 [Ilumatobacteraceae bacterium]
MSTVDGQYSATGKLPAGTTLLLRVNGRSGVAADATGVALNVTVTDPLAAGFITVYPCGDRPNASTVNFTLGATVANSVIAGVSAEGQVCLYTSATTDLVVDVGGYSPANSDYYAVIPGSLLETRSAEGLGTVDGAFSGIGQLQAGSTVKLAVNGRANLHSAAIAATLNVTVTDPLAAGFITVYPCGERPNTSNVNFTRGETVANSVIAGVSTDGYVCLYTSASTDLIVDVGGYINEMSK